MIETELARIAKQKEVEALEPVNWSVPHVHTMDQIDAVCGAFQMIANPGVESLSEELVDLVFAITRGASVVSNK